MKPNEYHIAELIGKYLWGQLSEQEEAELQHWLDEDERNQLLLDSFRNTEAAQGDIGFIQGIDVDVAWSKIRQQHSRLRLRRALRYVGYAASVALIACSWLWFSQPDDQRTSRTTEAGNIFHNDVQPGGNKAQLILSDGHTVDLRTYTDELQEQDGTQIVGSEGALTYATSDNHDEELIYNTLVIPRAGTYQLTLSDGSKIWLNAMSELRFPVHFGEKERVVYLKGEAYFEIAHDASKPFRVEVGGTQVEVLGTHFNINSYTQVTATLLEGAINISNPSGAQRLKPGQEAKVGEHITLHDANIEKAMAWKNGDFYFKSDDIREIMEQLSRWYDIAVHFENELPLRKFSGNIQRSVNLSEVLEMLSYVSDAKFEVSGQQVSVRF